MHFIYLFFRLICRLGRNVRAGLRVIVTLFTGELGAPSPLVESKFESKLVHVCKEIMSFFLSQLSRCHLEHARVMKHNNNKNKTKINSGTENKRKQTKKNH